MQGNGRLGDRMSERLGTILPVVYLRRFRLEFLHDQTGVGYKVVSTVLQEVIKAIRNPYTTILAHPTGRLLLARGPYAIDMKRIIDEASRSGVAIELNAHPLSIGH